MAKKKKNVDAKAGTSFEGSLADLESVVSELEQGELSLDESLSTYEAGVKHLRACYAALQKAEGQLRLLVDIDDAGNAKLKEFASGSTEEDSEEDSEDETFDDDDFSDEDPNDSTLF